MLDRHPQRFQVEEVVDPHSREQNVGNLSLQIISFLSLQLGLSLHRLLMKAFGLNHGLLLLGRRHPQRRSVTSFIGPLSRSCDALSRRVLPILRCRLPLALLLRHTSLMLDLSEKTALTAHEHPHNAANGPPNHRSGDA